MLGDDVRVAVIGHGGFLVFSFARTLMGSGHV